MATRKYVTEDERDLMITLYTDGKEVNEIAEITGRGRDTIYCTLAKYGYKVSRNQKKEDEVLMTVAPKKFKYKATRYFEPQLGRYVSDVTYAKYPDGISCFGMDVFGERFRAEFEEVE